MPSLRRCKGKCKLCTSSKKDYNQNDGQYGDELKAKRSNSRGYNSKKRGTICKNVPNKEEQIVNAHVLIRLGRPARIALGPEQRVTAQTRIVIKRWQQRHSEHIVCKIANKPSRELDALRDSQREHSATLDCLGR